MRGCDNDIEDQPNLDMYLSDTGDSTFFELINLRDNLNGNTYYCSGNSQGIELYADLYPKNSFDYENPQDSNNDNTYNIKVFFTDGIETAEYRFDVIVYNRTD